MVQTYNTVQKKREGTKKIHFTTILGFNNMTDKRFLNNIMNKKSQKKHISLQQYYGKQNK